MFLILLMAYFIGNFMIALGSRLYFHETRLNSGLSMVILSLFGIPIMVLFLIVGQCMKEDEK